jgi:polyhydroxyalkanoate synthesis regulator phasin
MGNKLAGQRAKFSRARATYFTAGEDSQRQRAVQFMAEVLVEAPANNFSEEMVTQGEDVPDEVRRFVSNLSAPSLKVVDDTDDELVGKVREALDTRDLVEIGEGSQYVYVYGYRCAPDRLKIGSCTGDVFARVAAQIGTSTPDRPTLLLAIKTHDCRALERALHGIFRLRGTQVPGAGAEWFRTTREEITEIYNKIVP